MFFVYAKASVFPRKLPSSPPTLPDIIIHCAKLGLHTLLAYFSRNDLISGKKETDWEIGRRGDIFGSKNGHAITLLATWAKRAKNRGKKGNFFFRNFFSRKTRM